MPVVTDAGTRYSSAATWNGLFPSMQSAYRKFHCTETAMARVLSDILMALDRAWRRSSTGPIGPVCCVRHGRSAAATVRTGLKSAASSTVAVPRTRSSVVTGHSRRPALVYGTNCHHRFVAFLLLLLLNVNSRHFYSITLFSTNIVRRPCCVSARVALILTF